MRGRLIQIFLAEIIRLDRALMIVAPSEAGVGFDPDFHEPVLVDRDDDGVGERRRLELPAVRGPWQIGPKTFGERRMFDAGDSPHPKLQLVMHFKDLERLGLVDARTSEPLVAPGDRLAALYDRAGELVQAIRTPSGLYVTEARPIGWGLNVMRPRRNLLLVTFDARQQAYGRAT